MKEFNVTLLKGIFPIKSWFQLGFTSNEVYWNVKEEYPVEIHRHNLHIEVSEVLSREASIKTQQAGVPS